MLRPWRPVLALATKCCVAEDAVVAVGGEGGELAWYRASATMAAEGNGDVDESEVGVGPLQLHFFSFSELCVVTHDFSSSYLLGEGGFGAVHMSFVDAVMRPGLRAQPLAVKKLDVAGLHGYKEWMAEVIFLSQFREGEMGWEGLEPSGRGTGTSAREEGHVAAVGWLTREGARDRRGEKIGHSGGERPWRRRRLA